MGTGILVWICLPGALGGEDLALLHRVIEIDLQLSL